jgi:hypothetical protein
MTGFPVSDSVVTVVTFTHPAEARIAAANAIAKKGLFMDELFSAKLLNNPKSRYLYHL